MLYPSKKNDTLMTYNPRAAHRLLELSGKEKTVEDAESPTGDGTIRFQLFCPFYMEHFVNYQCFLIDSDCRRGGPWLPVSNVYWGQGYHSQLLVDVNDIDIFRVHHC